MSRYIILGDIHGCFDELMDLLTRVEASDEDMVVSVGDLVDRGPDSPRVLQWFIDRCARGRAVVLMGNHERKHVRKVFSYSQEITRLQLGAQYEAATAWMAERPYFFETPEFVVVHAALQPGLPLAEQKEEVLAGTVAGERALQAALGGHFWHEVYAGPKPVVFGHHVVGDHPLVARGVIYGLDTGACHGGRLTALVVPGFTLHSVPARADHWEQTKRRFQAAVLLSKPWLDMGLAKASRELEQYADETGPALAALRTWLDSLPALIETCRLQLLAESERLLSEHGSAGFAVAVEPHPAKALLHLAARGRLDRDALQKRCPTPRKATELATQLGITPPVPTPRFEIDGALPAPGG